MLEAVREAAGEAIERGAASVEVTSVKELYGADAVYEAPVVVLHPRNPRAARLVVEVQDGQWWASAAGGPGFELWEGGPEEWLGEVRAMVAAVVAGRYEDGMAERRHRSLLRPWIWKTRTAWEGTFHTTRGPISTSHLWRGSPAGPPRRRFEPY